MLHVVVVGAGPAGLIAAETLASAGIATTVVERHPDRLRPCAGLVTRGRDAQRRPVRIDARMLAEATGWLENYRKLWESNFNRLDTLLDELKAERPQPDPTTNTKENANG